MSGKNSWTSINDIKIFIDKKWKKGLFLKELISQSDLFPLRIPLRGPSVSELSSRYKEAQEWVQQFSSYKGSCFSVEWEKTNYRVLGTNSVPVAVIFNHIQDTIKFIGKSSEAGLFVKLTEELLSSLPQLEPWVIKNPHRVLELASVLDRMVRIAGWIIDHPRPSIYIRQLGLKDVDTKFVEMHKRELGEWFDLVLDKSDIDTSFSGVQGFERSYGFLSKPSMVRFRILDKSRYINGISDLMIRTDEFCKLDLDVKTIFVTENDINGLSFPPVKDAMVIFGRGYGFDSLTEADWLKEKKIRYWGDIDTHGFAILSQFRSHFPKTESMLMDRGILMMHRNYWVRENIQSESEPCNLTVDELCLFRELRNNAFGDSVRLEQEFIEFDLVKGAVGQ